MKTHQRWLWFLAGMVTTIVALLLIVLIAVALERRREANCQAAKLTVEATLVCAKGPRMCLLSPTDLLIGRQAQTFLDENCDD